MNNLTKIVAAILVAVALVLAVLAWWLGGRPPMISAAQAAIGNTSKQYQVVVAAHNLEAGKAIASDDIWLVTLPIDPLGAYNRTSSVIGKVPLSEIGTGTPITESALAGGLAVKLAEDERAVAISAKNLIGADNRVQPGDYVDVFFTRKHGRDINKTQSRLLISRLHVLSYGVDLTENDSAGVSGGANLAQPSSSPILSVKQSRHEQQLSGTVVLAIPVASVNRLLLAMQNGKLMLALRNPSDVRTPDPVLFSPQDPVLNGKKDLTCDQKEELNMLDNQAFAGAEQTMQAGEPTSTATHKPFFNTRSTQRPAMVAHRSNVLDTVEIIRGMQRESATF